MNITGDGTYTLPTAGHSVSTIFVSGTADGATLTLKVNGVAIPGGLLAVDEEYEFRHGLGVDVKLVVASAGGSTDVRLEVHRL